MRKDSTFGTIFVALAVCLVCAVFVSTAAVYLKPLQEENKALDKKQNILAVADLLQEGKSVEELFTKVEPRVVNLETGEFEPSIDPAEFDAREAAKDPDRNVEIPGDEDIASIRSRAKYATVYFVNEGEKAGLMIMPVHGYALWSTLYGFIALESDGQTVYGLSFYEHAETPGLGGEIDNPKWKSLWKGKKVFGEDGDVQLQVIKGNVGGDTPNAEHKVDGLAGATLTSVGVSNLLRYWLSDQGYGPFLDRVRSGEVQVVNNG
ncbi:MAG: Na(+)-translocating NADH-quinone reductase subunit C [Salinisphaeraceae bacterium]|nr:Na(+)-translocating NADH-quinone reductase subunit C [Salinisphaeraceae bacterium]